MFSMADCPHGEYHYLRHKIHHLRQWQSRLKLSVDHHGGHPLRPIHDKVFCTLRLTQTVKKYAEKVSIIRHTIR